MKTFSFYATYHYEEWGEVEAPDYDSALEQIENDRAYVVSDGGYTVPWDYVKINELAEIDDDGEDDDA